MTALIQAGANPDTRCPREGTPLVFTTNSLRKKKVWGRNATEEELNRLEGVRRLLRVEDVHAMSWLWHGDVRPSIKDAEDKRKLKVGGFGIAEGGLAGS